MFLIFLFIYFDVTFIKEVVENIVLQEQFLTLKVHQCKFSTKTQFLWAPLDGPNTLTITAQRTPSSLVKLELAPGEKKNPTQNSVIAF